jgi:hypothetical protein
VIPLACSLSTPYERIEPNRRSITMHPTYGRDMCRLGVGEAWIPRRNVLQKDRPVLKLVDIKVTRECISYTGRGNVRTGQIPITPSAFRILVTSWHATQNYASYYVETYLSVLTRRQYDEEQRG